MRLRGGGPSADSLGGLRGGGGDADIQEIAQEIQKAGDTFLRLLDKSAPTGSLDSYYDVGDRTLQNAAGKVQDCASSAWSFFGDVVCPKAEQAALRAYYLAQHPVEARAALESGASDAFAAARAFKNSIPGADRVQRDVRGRWLRWRIERPVASEITACAASAVGSYLAVTAAAQRLAFRQGWTQYTSRGQPAQVLGVAAVCLAGLAAGEASHTVASKLRPNTYRLASASRDISLRKQAARLAPVRRRGAAERIADALVSVALFKFLLRGSFRKIAPSDLTKPGPFAREWVETNGENYATYGQRMRVNAIGWKRGCHHCGARGAGGFLWLSKKWICDHQPPNKIVAMAQV